jgi:hypothetical protein
VLVDHLPTALKEEIFQQKENIHTDYLACTAFLKSRAESTGTVESIQPDEYEWAWLCGKKERIVNGSII